MDTKINVDGKTATFELLGNPRWPLMYDILNYLIEKHIKSSNYGEVPKITKARDTDYDILEKYGLIHYFKNPDGNFRYLYITRKGVIIMKKIKEIEQQMEKRFFDPEVKIQLFDKSWIYTAMRYALTIIIDSVNLKLDMVRGVAEMDDLSYKGSKNEKHIRVLFNDPKNIYCNACESNSCEHVALVKFVLQYQYALLSLLK
ncbi:MAG: hypothetical protein ACP5TO_07015 [Thermoplasmata archaeon]